MPTMCLSESPSKDVDDAFDRLLDRKMSRTEMEHWASREVEFRSLHD